jgi:hypothetical protein
MRRLTMLIVWGVVLIGVAGGVVALRSRGGQEVFEAEQSGALAVTPARVVTEADVAAVVAQAPEPVPAAERTRPALVRCRPGAAATLRNPWSCTIRYRSGTSAHYRVTVQPDGHYSGVGTGIISGCCVKVPTLDE